MGCLGRVLMIEALQDCGKQKRPAIQPVFSVRQVGVEPTFLSEAVFKTAVYAIPPLPPL